MRKIGGTLPSTQLINHYALPNQGVSTLLMPVPRRHVHSLEQCSNVLHTRGFPPQKSELHKCGYHNKIPYTLGGTSLSQKNELHLCGYPNSNPIRFKGSPFPEKDGKVGMGRHDSRKAPNSHKGKLRYRLPGVCEAQQLHDIFRAPNQGSGAQRQSLRMCTS